MILMQSLCFLCFIVFGHWSDECEFEEVINLCLVFYTFLYLHSLQLFFRLTDEALVLSFFNIFFAYLQPNNVCV